METAAYQGQAVTAWLEVVSRMVGGWGTQCKDNTWHARGDAQRNCGGYLA